MVKKNVFVFSFSFFVFTAGAQVNWPAVTSTTKPWTRWWWEGSAVNKRDLTWNLEQYQKVGLGGVEITPIYGVYGYEKEFIDFLSPQWLSMLRHTLDESKRLGLGVDIANATGWPFGGPWVKEEDASKSVYFKTYTVDGGKRLDSPVTYKRDAFVRTANNKPASADTLKRPVWTNNNLQALALDQIVYAEELPVQTLMAYNGSQSVNLTKYVGKDGMLDWTAPGNEKWTLYAVFSGLHGKMVERAAPGGEGYAIDHFSATAANNYFKKFDAAFKGFDLSYLRAFFNDSYEVDDARGQANWTPLLFAEFKKRRGYDLRQHLPALFGKDEKEKNQRVLYDYRATIDELILHNFTEIWKRWGSSKGAMVRNQSHGSPANTLDLYDAVDIPETEGTDILRFKFATSVTNVSGKKLAAAESATWLNEHFLSNWGDVKKLLDLYFLGGVNHVIYHGTEYSPKDAPWPGWLFYAAVHFQPENPQWKDFGALNAYVTRVQSFLQGGKPDNDVLLYYPLVDKYSEQSRELLQHFDGMERNFVNSDFEHVSKWMLEEGYGFDFFSDRQLQKFKATGASIQTTNNAYKTILLPANQLMTEASFQKLLALAKAGVTILAYKDMPSDVPGWHGLEERRKIFQQLVAQLSFKEEGKVKKAVVGKGAFVVSDNLEALLTAAAVKHEVMVEKGLSFIRRKNSDGKVYFINNRTEKTVYDWVPLRTKAASVFFFEPMGGDIRGAKYRTNPQGETEVLLQLQPYQSIIMQTYGTAKKGAAYSYAKQAGPPVELNGEWNISFLTGGPTLPKSFTTNKLESWTESSADGANFSGTAKNTTTFTKPSGTAQAWVLDLGKVHETAEVFLNGKKLATLVGPTFQVTIPASSLKASNTLEVVVANLMANRIIYMDKANLPWKIFYNTNMPARRAENAKGGIFTAAGWKPLPSGILGPVTLTPVNYE
ncbi:glycoside hydrolase family 2 protein [Flavisolibacter sp. BT320]|nr:glycoside hydrolase family 2 protein [Flavisolibacter longurius]